MIVSFTNMKFEVPLGNSARNKISELKTDIYYAKKAKDYQRVTFLEAELEAVEQGKKFDREQFLLERVQSGSRAKHHALRDMQNVPNSVKDNWLWDGVYFKQYEHLSYESTFRPILSQIGVQNFQELIDKRAIETRQNLHVLDLFGGAYFLSDLTHVTKLVGVRLKNIDEAVLTNCREKYEETQLTRELDILNELTELTNNPKRTVIEGNLYKGKTWNKLKKENMENSGKGFDIIICRPEAPFRDSTVLNWEKISDDGIAKEEIFVGLLERTLELLSTNDGLLFTQIPSLNTSDEIWNIFWKRYIDKKQKEGYEFLFGSGRLTPSKDIFAVKRTQKNKY